MEAKVAFKVFSDNGLTILKYYNYIDLYYDYSIVILSLIITNRSNHCCYIVVPNKIYKRNPVGVTLIFQWMIVIIEVVLVFISVLITHILIFIIRIRIHLKVGGGVEHRRKRLEIGGDRMESTSPRRRRGHFNDNKEC